MPLQIPVLTLKIGGANVSQAFMDAVDEIVVDDSLHMPGMVTIVVRDPEGTYVDDTGLLDLGKEVQVDIKSVDRAGTERTGTLIKAEITSLEPYFSSKGDSTLMIRAYHKSHRLHRGKKTRTFLQTKDSDMASTVAGEAGLGASTDPTSVTYSYVLQHNQTNMEFLLERAARIGYQVYAADVTLYFKKGSANLGTGPTLTLCKELTSFQPRFSALGQTDQMIVDGWDSKAKTLLTATQSPNAALNQGGMTQTGGAAAQSKFSAASAVLTDRVLADSSDATAVATGLADDIAREYMQAEGVCRGHPGIKPGYKITIQGVGTRFSGSYLVTATTHTFNKTGYETRFTVSGRTAPTLSSLLGSGNGHSAERSVVHGVVVGMVTNLQDPEDLGRVKVKYPGLPKNNGSEIESDWMRIASPMAGAQRGIQYLPEVNDEVLIAFEYGEVHRPFIVGVLWSSVDKPPLGKSVAVGSDGKVIQRVTKTRAGHTILLGDKQGEEFVEVKTKSGHFLRLDDKSGSEKVTLKDKTGNNSIEIDSTSNAMTLKANGDITIEAKGKLILKSTMDTQLTATGKFVAKGTGGLDLSTPATGALKASGSLEVFSSGMTSVKSSGMLQIQGSIVKIN